MADLRGVYRRWQRAHYERQRLDIEAARIRSRAFLGAYGVDVGPAGDGARHAG